MRGFFILSALSASIVVASGQSGHAQTAAPQPANPPPPQLLSPDKEGSANVQNAAEAPLHDLNLVRQKIPPVLLAALADPYARPRPFNCRTIVADVEGLREALGGDFDEPDNPQRPSLTTQRGVVLRIAHGAAEMLLPFAGFVSTLSGAGKHDQLVSEVIIAGSVRRSYLKGLGEAYRCPFPAYPNHQFVQPQTQIAPEHRAPEYPIH